MNISEYCMICFAVGEKKIILDWAGRAMVQIVKKVSFMKY